MNIPTHYNGTDLMDLLIKHNVDFCSGNIIKYVFRFKQKDGLSDLYKARDYLEALIAFQEKEKPFDN